MLHGGQALVAPAYLAGVSQLQAYNNGKLVGSTLPTLQPPPPPPSHNFLAQLVGIIVFVIVFVFSGFNAVAAAAAQNMAEQHATNMMNGHFDWKRWAKLTLNPFSGNAKDFMRIFYDPLGQGDHEYMNYKSVAKAAAVAYVSEGIAGEASGAASGASAEASSTFSAIAMQEARRYAASTVMTALTSEHFSWKSVTASYIAQHVGSLAGDAFKGLFPDAGYGPNTWGKYGQLAVSSAAQNAAYQVIRDGHVNWREVGLNTAYSMGRGLINDNLEALGGGGSFGAMAASAALNGALAKARHQNVASAMMSAVGEEFKRGILGYSVQDNLQAGVDRLVGVGFNAISNKLDELGNPLESGLAERGNGRSYANDSFIGIDMQAMLKSGEMTASLSGVGSPMRSWSGDGEIMSDFDSSGYVYANDYEYQNRDHVSSPDYVTNEQVKGADGTPGLRATDVVRNAYADALQRVQTMDVKQIFDRNDPHQYMVFIADDGTRNGASQAIPTNPRTLYQLIDRSANVLPIYVSGVGTENDLGGLNSAFGLGASLQVRQTIMAVNEQVNAVIQSDPDARFVFADTAFSRGSGLIRAVQNILVQQGVPDLSSAYEAMDGEATKMVYGRNIIEPGKVNIGASLIYDTVQTGTLDFMNTKIPSQVQQTLHLTAANEYRTFFPLTSSLRSAGDTNSSVVEWSLPGAHTNLGGGSYDMNGIGAANLEIGYTYLQRVGVPLAPLPSNRLPDPSQFVIYDSRWVHDVPFGQLVNNPDVHRVIKYHK